MNSFFDLIVGLADFNQRNRRAKRFASFGALKLRKLHAYYMLVINGMMDINEIANRLQTKPKTALKYLKRLVRQANTKRKIPYYDWKALVNAYIDYEQNKIVLDAPADKLIICTGVHKYTQAIIHCISALIMFAVSLIGFILKPIDPTTSLGLIITIFIIGFLSSIYFVYQAFQVILTSKRLEYLYDLIENQNITSIKHLAEKTSQTEIEAKKELLEIIHSGQFANARIDRETNSVKLGKKNLDYGSLIRFINTGSLSQHFSVEAIQSKFGDFKY